MTDPRLAARTLSVRTHPLHNPDFEIELVRPGNKIEWLPPGYEKLEDALAAFENTVRLMRLNKVDVEIVRLISFEERFETKAKVGR